MKVLSIKQPWAWLIVCKQLRVTVGYNKDIENRTWKTDYRGELLIHAPQKFDYDALLWLHEQKLSSIARFVIEHFEVKFHPETCEPIGCDTSECGGIVGQANLDGIISNSKSIWAMSDCYHWQLSNAKELPFIPCKGRLSLWMPTEEILKALKKGGLNS